MKQPNAQESAPAHDYTRSRVVAPARHEPTGRTVGRIQDGSAGESHLFSATGSFIATVKTSALPPEWRAPAAVAPAPTTPPPAPAS